MGQTSLEWPLLGLLCLFFFAAADTGLQGPVFVLEPPNKIDFSNSTGTVVECAARGSPPPRVTWVRGDGQPVDDVTGLRQVFSNGTLRFLAFRAEDYRQEIHAQVYRCLANNSEGSVVSRDVHVRAVVAQQYSASVNPVYVVAGNAAVLRCELPSHVADLVTVTSWVDGDGAVFFRSAGGGVSGDDGKYLVLPSGELHIRDVTPEDGLKSFRCRTVHRLTGETRLSATEGRLVVSEPVSSGAPRVPAGAQGATFYLRAAAPGALHCRGQGYPAPVFRWFKFEEGSSRRRPVQLDDRVRQVAGTLIIREARVQDSGKYLCQVNNTVGGESVETVLTVTAPLSSSITPPSQVVDFGKPAQFTCTYKGNPVKALYWMKDGVKIGHDEPTLSIRAVTKSDKGMYQCFVINDQESAQATAELRLGGKFDPPALVETFEARQLEPGISTHLKCAATGDPTPEITWFIDDTETTSRDRFQVSHSRGPAGTVVSFLNVTSILTNDGGLFKCRAASKVGAAEHQARIDVRGLPHVKPMKKMSVVAGETLIKTCPVAGYPIDTITWEMNARVLPRDARQKVFPNGTLIITNVQRQSDQGTYTCVARSTHGYMARANLEVLVMVPPEIFPFPALDALSDGDDASLQCYVYKGDTPMTISWTFHGRDVSMEREFTTQAFGDRTSMLLVKSVSHGHSGTYTCRARNAAGATQLSTSLVVRVPPRWIIEPTDKEFALSSTAEIQCKADGFPKPRMAWKKAAGSRPEDYRALGHSDSSIQVRDDGTLVINSIQKRDEGYYLCEADNQIGPTLSAVIYVNVQAPPHFEIKLRNQTARLGDPAVLVCEARGEQPITIKWSRNGAPLSAREPSPRYTIRQQKTEGGASSDLSLQETSRRDSATYTCVASNPFGQDNTTINLIVQEKPEVPFAIKVLNKSGRSVELSWSAPYNGNSDIFQYIIQYKKAKDEWDSKEMERVVIPGKMEIVSVMDLRPATAYQMRIIAENEVGPSEPSEVVTIVTSEEPPAGPPTAVVVEPLERGLLVTWKPPSDELLNGEVLGYYVGHRLSNSKNSFSFQTFEFANEATRKHQVSITKLEEFREYEVVVQAFNSQGSGPQSEEQRQFTAEGVPSAPPQEITCRTLTSDSIRASWTPPPAGATNGVIRGYKVMYGPSSTWYDDSTIDMAKSTSTETLLTGLKKYTEYNITVLAYTGGGDGPRSRSAICRTEEDVPEAPAAIKALAMSSDSILVSWRQPENPNGIIKRYTVYFMEEGSREPQMHRVTPFQQSYRASGLKKTQNYQFWVNADTSMGEGPPSNKVTVTPRSQVPARIASFDDELTVNFQQDAKLPCLAVGLPQPTIAWHRDGKPFQPNDRMRIMPEGSLQIRGVQRGDRGEYSCIAKNQFGQDTVSHKLVVQAPPYPPEVLLIGSSNNSIEVRLKPDPNDSVPLFGFTLHYKAAFGEWETVQVPKKARSFTLESPWCGTKHQIYATAFNGVGPGEQSAVLTTRTKGQAPTMPPADRFLRIQAKSVELHLNTWKNGGCPILYFVVEYRKRFETEWTTASNALTPDKSSFMVMDLEPATWYDLRATAHNNAGSTQAEYLFATLDEEGGTVGPPLVRPGADGDDWWDQLPAWLPDLNVLVPTACGLLVLLVGLCVLCVYLGSRNRNGAQRFKDDAQYTQPPPHQNRLYNEELGYIAPPNRKLPPIPGSTYSTLGSQVKRMPGGALSVYGPANPRHQYEELTQQQYQATYGAPPRPPPHGVPTSPSTYYSVVGPNGEEEIAPYATFHLLGFREEMDPSGETPAGCQTMAPRPGQHGRQMSAPAVRTLPRNTRYSQPVNPLPPPAHQARASLGGGGGGSVFSPTYDDPARSDDEANYNSSQYSGGGPYAALDDSSSRTGTARRNGPEPAAAGWAADCGSLPPPPPSLLTDEPLPPPPPPRASLDDSNTSQQTDTSAMECDRDQALLADSPQFGKDGRPADETRKLLDSDKESNEARRPHGTTQNGALVPYDTVNV
ncbi:Down syndrome cell adhesion molecule-like protein Dscam2 isoform X5 [Amphibalanus amphitrite]|uniref:Down syndrome cell adhesion molecule-like protein Dscam2 isoform X5 n=1 Tax=Amphibalanus amphitrite TaxID=1232801 RepID=UPI001C916AB2|nr:Down syndrome cell adhesion molecule-like protein Dscam2 isoform X5 [Amphibalanus amphitrite]